MAVSAIKNLGDAPVLIAGQSDIVIFNAPTGGYTASTTFAQCLEGGSSLGQVVQDSTSWDGDAVSFDKLLDEQGDVITSKANNATHEISFDLVDFEPEFIKLFLGADEISENATGLSALIDGTVHVYGFGDKLPVVVRPLMIINDESNRALFFPKLKIAGGLDWSDNIWKIHVVGTAEYVDTANLKTVMPLTSSGHFKYSSGSEESGS